MVELAGADCVVVVEEPLDVVEVAFGVVFESLDSFDSSELSSELF